MRSNGKRGMGLVFLGVGVLIFLVLGTVAVFLGVGESRRAQWPQTDGVVVDLVRSSTSSGGTSTASAPVVRFTVDGQEYTFRSSVSTSSPPAEGSTVRVAYDPADPHQATIVGSTLWVGFLIGGLGVLFLLVFGGIGFGIARGGPSHVSVGIRLGGRTRLGASRGLPLSEDTVQDSSGSTMVRETTVTSPDGSSQTTRYVTTTSADGSTTTTRTETIETTAAAADGPQDPPSVTENGPFPGYRPDADDGGVTDGPIDHSEPR